MHRLLSASRARLLTASCIAAVLVVWAYETRVLDSHTTVPQSGVADPLPAAGKTLRFKATAYCKGTTTASGVRVRSGIAAADPQLLPVGSVLDIKAGDDRYSGVYTVLDTGPAVQGRILDLYIWSCHEALKFGRRAVQVTVLRLGWDPTASSPATVDRLFGRREAARRPPPPQPPAPQAF